MTDQPAIDQFLATIMDVHVRRMGGALAGITGGPSGANETTEKLKRAGIAFATELRKPQPDSNELGRLADDIDGYVRILQLNYVMSDAAAKRLMEQLQALV